MIFIIIGNKQAMNFSNFLLVIKALIKCDTYCDRIYKSASQQNVAATEIWYALSRHT